PSSGNNNSTGFGFGGCGGASDSFFAGRCTVGCSPVCGGGGTGSRGFACVSPSLLSSVPHTATGFDGFDARPDFDFGASDLRANGRPTRVGCTPKTSPVDSSSTSSMSSSPI